MPAMHILDTTGHTSVAWRPDDPTSVARAAGCFADLRRQCRLAFRVRVDDPTAPPEQVDHFDPYVDGDLFWVRPLQGG